MYLQFFIFLAFCGVAQSAKSKLQVACEALPQSFFHGTNCYVLKTGSDADFEGSKLGCTDMHGGVLAHIQNLSVMRLILDALLRPLNVATAWTGLYVDAGGDYTYFRPDATMLLTDANYRGERRWANAAVSMPTNSDILWEAGQPTGAPEGCTVLSAQPGGLNDRDCAESHAQLCQYMDTRSHFLPVSESKRVSGGQMIGVESDMAHRLQCATACHDLPECAGFSFQHSTGKCRLHWIQDVDLMETAADYKVYERI